MLHQRVGGMSHPEPPSVANPESRPQSETPLQTDEVAHSLPAVKRFETKRLEFAEPASSQARIGLSDRGEDDLSTGHARRVWLLTRRETTRRVEPGCGVAVAGRVSPRLRAPPVLAAFRAAAVPLMRRSPPASAGGDVLCAMSGSAHGAGLKPDSAHRLGAAERGQGLRGSASLPFEVFGRHRGRADPLERCGSARPGATPATLAQRS